MTYSCIHTHSTFCDGLDTIETICAAAYERGFASIGFSSHAPLGEKTGLTSDWHMGENRLDEYVETVRRARRRWEGRLAVFLGLEVDYIRGLMGPADRDIQALGLDYLIGSVHYVFPPGKDLPMAVDSPGDEFERDMGKYFSGDGEALAAAYWDSLDEMILAGGFDILGHADLVKKNNPGQKWFSTGGPDYRRRLEKTAAITAEAGITVEVNTGGLNRGRIPETYPSLEMLRLLGAKKVPLTITADAHRVGELGGHYGEARRTIMAAGYTGTMFFEGRREGRPVWRAEALEEGEP
ncbi:MAG: histidinol-phosphatase [Spirochaetaceae bacterium]|jgi:histidinol-phosphatase (PHP family)|nr:histidinol-phosphatase [Spirochaetaceae bacterium]